MLKVIVQLVRTLDKVKNSAARALIIWIFGEYNSMGIVIPKIAPTVLKYLAWSFPSDEVEAKLQILNTCAKVPPLLLFFYYSYFFDAVCFIKRKNVSFQCSPQRVWPRDLYKVGLLGSIIG
jgi:hypothetical protein